MKAMKAWIAVAVAVAVLVFGAGAFAATRLAGGDSQTSTPPTSAPAASAAGLTPTAAVTADMVGNLLDQITQATGGGGQPRAITPAEAEALLRQQLQQLGVPTS